MLKKLTATLFLLLACSLLLTECAYAQAPQLASSKTQKAAEVLAHARQLYSEEGARVALPEFEKALAMFRQDGDRKSAKRIPRTPRRNK